MCASAQCQADWQAQVRSYCQAKDWDSAMRVVEQAITKAPNDMDVREWRARVLLWSGRVAEAEAEYLGILKIAGRDADKWLGLATVYFREGKNREALGALDAALALDPNRADLHEAKSRALRAMGRRVEARSEFQAALRLDNRNAEARSGLLSVREEAKQELRIGNDNDSFNFTGANHDEWATLTSQWTPRWKTTFAESFYQRGGADAAKFLSSVTRQMPEFATLTAGGAVGHDNAVIPKSEAFFDLDRGWKVGQTSFVRALELEYTQHWYWYQASRILTLSGAGTAYLLHEWSLTVSATGARSAFSGEGAEWRPSGVGRLAFPLTRWRDRRLSGNLFFAAGAENFAQLDQIGRFASQTYGGGVRFQLNARQDVTSFASYQRRTQSRTDTTFGFSYGIHF